MIPVGHMAKHVCAKPEWLHAPQVVDIYSVSTCQSEKFADYIPYWEHKGFDVVNFTARTSPALHSLKPGIRTRTLPLVAARELAPGSKGFSRWKNGN